MAGTAMLPSALWPIKILLQKSMLLEALSTIDVKQSTRQALPTHLIPIGGIGVSYNHHDFPEGDQVKGAVVGVTYKF